MGFFEILTRPGNLAQWEDNSAKMCSVVLDGTPVAVDNWKPTPGVRLFFLTHIHKDRLEGLTPTWKFGPIFCSQLTKKLLHHEYGELSGLVRGLAIGKTHTINLDDNGHETMSVTLIDANHCQGAVMYFFQGYFGNILFTGDFRFHDGMLDHPALRHAHVDRVYLDNRYCNSQYTFPPQDTCLALITNLIERYKDHHVVIGMETWGKEELLVNLAMQLKTMIFVDEARKARLDLLGLPRVFTSDPRDECYIRVVAQHQLTTEYLVRCNSKRKTIGILPTTHTPHGVNDWKAAQNFVPPTMPFVVPYSLHSSVSELGTFLEQLLPKAVIPLVAGHEVCPFQQFKSLAQRPQQRTYEVPLSVRAFMAKTGPPAWSVGGRGGRRDLAVCHKRKATGITSVFRPQQRRTVSYCGVLSRDMRTSQDMYTSEDVTDDEYQGNSSPMPSFDKQQRKRHRAAEADSADVTDMARHRANDRQGAGVKEEVLDDESSQRPEFWQERLREHCARLMSSMRPKTSPPTPTAAAKRWTDMAFSSKSVPVKKNPARPKQPTVMQSPDEFFCDFAFSKKDRSATNCTEDGVHQRCTSAYSPPVPMPKAYASSIQHGDGLAKTAISTQSPCGAIKNIYGDACDMMKRLLARRNG